MDVAVGAAVSVGCTAAVAAILVDAMERAVASTLIGAAVDSGVAAEHALSSKVSMMMIFFMRQIVSLVRFFFSVEFGFLSILGDKVCADFEARQLVAYSSRAYNEFALSP